MQTHKLGIPIFDSKNKTFYTFNSIRMFFKLKSRFYTKFDNLIAKFFIRLVWYPIQFNEFIFNKNYRIYLIKKLFTKI